MMDEYEKNKLGKIPHQPPILSDLNAGDIVEIMRGGWRGETGVYVGKEETIIGTLLRVQISEDTACLVSRMDIRKVRA